MWRNPAPGATLTVQSLRLSSLSRPPHGSLGYQNLRGEQDCKLPKPQTLDDLSVCQAALVLLHLLQKLRIIHAFSLHPLLELATK